MEVNRKQFLKVGSLLIMAAVAGCTEAETPLALNENGYFPRKVYAFQHRETTGLTDYIYVGEREQTTRFASESDQQALNRLRALHPDVFAPLADGKHIFVVGDLSRTESQTPNGANRATGEPFREFRLRDWYIVAPFEEWRSREGVETSQVVPRTELRITDFDSRVSPDLAFDPRRYQKTREEHRRFAARFAGM